MKINRISIILTFLVLTPFFFVSGQKTLEIEDVMNPFLYPAQLSGLQWMGNSYQYTWVKDNNLMIGGPLLKEDKILLSLDTLNDAMSVAGFKNLRRFPFIIWIDENTFRFNYGASLITFSLLTGKATKIHTLPEETDNVETEPKTLSAAYTVNDNVFVTIGGKETQVTFDGGNGIVNGKTVHRNEFGISNGLFWSPAGNLLAFYRKDESMVTEYPLVDIEPRTAEVITTRYPMAGMTSEEVKVGVFDIRSGKTVFLNTGEPAEQYLTNVTWSPDEKKIYIAILNRGQNHLKLNCYDAATGSFEKTLFEETSSLYVEPENGPLFLPNNPKQFIWQSERNGWNHLYLYDTEGKLLKRFTSGNWMVTRIDGFDKSGNMLYFHSTEVSPIEDHVYQLDLKKGRIIQVSSVRGSHSVQPSADGKYFIDQYSNNGGIASRIDLLDQKGKMLKTLLQNEDPLREYEKAEVLIDTLFADDGTPLYYRMILPPGFDRNMKYPVFLYLYGGPHNQLISDSWLGGAGLFLTYMAHKGYIVFSLDNRGSANRGYDFESVIHRKLGQTESEDQMKGVEYLLSLPYVDKERMGIHGWSYGGFMTITMMQKYPGVFKAGVAGGPVIDWKYYEVMYGERYMDTPEENPMGYENANLINSVDDLKGRLLIIQGTMDDVVVWQHSLAYLKKCIEKGKLVDYFVYPGHGHNVRGPDRLHLFKKIEQYMSDHL